MTDERNLPAKSENKGESRLQQSGAGSSDLFGMAISNLTPEQLSTITAEAVKEKLRLEVDAEKRNLDYGHGKKSAEDHVDTFNMLEKGGKTTRNKLVSDVKTGAGNMRIESKSGATCFVASAAYENPNHKDVVFLRRYRDEVLTRSLLGRRFISFYWKVGPHLAKPVKAVNILRIIFKTLIGLVVKILKRSTR